MAKARIVYKATGEKVDKETLKDYGFVYYPCTINLKKLGDTFVVEFKEKSDSKTFRFLRSSSILLPESMKVVVD